MKIIVILWVLIVTGCNLFKVEEPIVVEPIVEEVKDSIRVDTVMIDTMNLINAIDTNNIVIDTLKSE